MNEQQDAHEPKRSSAGDDEHGPTANFERSINEARDAVDRSRNIRQAIQLRRLLRRFRHDGPRDAGGLDGGTDSTYHA